MIWGRDDCLIDILGADAHKKIGWVEGYSHNQALAFVAALPRHDRYKLFTDTARGQGWQQVNDMLPGDVCIGFMMPVTGNDFALLNPWFAVMQIDFMWYVRLPHSYRAVEPARGVEVYRCPPQP